MFHSLKQVTRAFLIYDYNIDFKTGKLNTEIQIKSSPVQTPVSGRGNEHL